MTIGAPLEFHQNGGERENEQHSDRRYKREDLPVESINRRKRRMSTDTVYMDPSHTRRQNLNDQRSGGQRERVFGRLVDIMHNKVTKENSQIYGNGKGKKRVSGCVDSDDSSSNSGGEVRPKKKGQPRVTTLEELNQAVLGRNYLESILDKPMFMATIIGCYVRLKHKSEFKVFRIVDHYLAKEPYLLGTKETKITLNVKHGAESYSSTMNFVSNKEFSPQEFHKWIETNRRDGLVLPTLYEIAKKQVEMERTSAYIYTESDVENLIKAKGMSGQNQKIAHKKINLIMKRDAALGVNDAEKVAQLDKKMEMIEEQARAQVENTREHRKPIPRIPRVNHVPTLYRHDVAGPSGSKRTLADRVPKSKETDLEQYMRRTYRRSAVGSRKRVGTDERDGKEASRTVSKEIPTVESDEEKKKPFRLNLGLDLKGLGE